jgi:plastocyanin
MAGVRYSSRSLVATGQPNEWQPYLRWSPVAARGDPRAAISATGAWNAPNESFDGELSGQLHLGPVFALGAVRGFSKLYGDLADDPGGALGLAGGLGVRLNRYVTLAGDVADVVSGGEIDGASPGVGWSAGLHLGLPFTPHTFSIMATNVSSGTLQGASGIPAGFPDEVYWGFEFTVPFSGFARWGRIFDPDGDADDAAARTALAAGDSVVEIEIRGLSFARRRVEVPAGTTVRWVNRDPIAHTSTSDDDIWGSRAIGPGETFERTFGETGEFGYHCIPHPFMRGTIVVTSG